MRNGAAVIAGNGAKLAAFAVVASLASPAAAATAEAPRTRYLWNLATETGPIRTSGSALSFDPFSNELLVSGAGVVRIFQANGMEDYNFPAGGMVDLLLGAAVLGEGGDIAVLGTTGQRWSLVRASFRGERLGTIEPKGAPAGFLDTFGPAMVRVQGGRIYLVDVQGLRALVLEQDGTVVRAVDLAKVLDVPASKLGEVQLSGFGVDVDGGLLLTIAVRFKAYALSPAGELREWGTPGGAPGLFNVVSGIAADAHHYYVADQLKCAVIAFDRKDLGFVDEFGYRRVQSAGGLVGPTQVEAGNGRVFVSQNANRGVAVFAAPAEAQVSPQKLSAAASAGGAAPQ